MIYSRIKNRGFTLVEVLVYTAGAVLVIATIAVFLYYAFGWYRSVAIPARADQIGETLVDRLEKDIRSSQNITNIVRGTNQGSISMVSLLSTTTTATKTYSIQNNRIVYTQNGGAVNYLTPSDISATTLNFYQNTSSYSTAIHFSFSLNFRTKNGFATTTYNGYAILKNSY